MRLTEVALVTECGFVDSPGSVRQFLESDRTIIIAKDRLLDQSPY